MPIVLFIVQFAHLPLSENPKNWGEAGDYFGGMLNPIISLVGVAVTIYIAYHVQKLSKQQGAQQMEIQKKLLLTEFRYKVLTDLQEKVNAATSKIEIIISTNQSPQDELDVLIREFNRLHDIDHNIFHLDQNLMGLVMRTIEDTEEWKNFGRFNDKVKFYAIRGDIQTILKSLTEQVLFTTR
jgi:hypothetical protein